MALTIIHRDQIVAHGATSIASSLFLPPLHDRGSLICHGLISSISAEAWPNASTASSKVKDRLLVQGAGAYQVRNGVHL